MQPGLGHGIGIADLCPAALSFVLRLQEVAFLARRQGPDPETFKVGIADVVGRVSWLYELVLENRTGC